MKKAFISLSLLCAVALIVVSCKKDKDNKDPNAYTIATSLRGSNEVPANAAVATGTLSGTYNKSTNKLTYTINWTGLTGTASAMHFHGPAVAGINAGVAVGLTITNPAVAGGATGEVTITEAQETDLLGGMWYLNVHSAAFPGGEIRGQVAATQ